VVEPGNDFFRAMRGQGGISPAPAPKK
jgi:hypothetical protein